MATGRKTGGRKRGTPNKATKELRPVLLKVIQRELVNLSELISELEPKDRIDAITKLLPYIMPKMKQVDHISNNEVNEPLEIRVVYPKNYGILGGIKVDGKSSFTRGNEINN